MKAHNKVATKYSHVFRKDGFMALREARNGQTSLVKLAKLLNIKEGTLGHVFGRSYKDTANWRNILRVADLLSVPRAEFVKYHWVEALPPEMEAYEIPEVQLKRKYTKKSEVLENITSNTTTEATQKDSKDSGGIKPTRAEMYRAMENLASRLADEIRDAGGGCKRCIVKENGKCVNDGENSCDSLIIDAYLHGGRTLERNRQRYL